MFEQAHGKTSGHSYAQTGLPELGKSSENAKTHELSYNHVIIKAVEGDV